MQFLGCLFALILGLIFVAVAFLGSIVNFILSVLGFNKRVQQSAGFRDGSATGSAGTGSRQPDEPHSTAGQSKGKIFKKDDSEYVDFEEV